MQTVVTKKFHFHCSHLLPAHKGLCRNLHGHTYHIEIGVKGNIRKESSSSRGMIIDFGELTRIVEKEVISKLDHAFVYNIKSVESRKIAEFLDKTIKQKLCYLPYDSTAENLCDWIWNKICMELTQKKVKLWKVTVYETDTSYAQKSRGVYN